ncbi:MAG: hypothetical protein AAGI51_11785, partial [Pseudomonadota bacterium]
MIARGGEIADWAHDPSVCLPHDAPEAPETRVKVLRDLRAAAGLRLRKPAISLDVAADEAAGVTRDLGPAFAACDDAPAFEVMPRRLRWRTPRRSLCGRAALAGSTRVEDGDRHVSSALASVARRRGRTLESCLHEALIHAIGGGDDADGRRVFGFESESPMSETQHAGNL